MTQDELAEARSEIAALHRQIAELQADKAKREQNEAVIRESYETRIAELHEQLVLAQPPDDPWTEQIRNWLAAQGTEWRHPSWRILKNAVGIDHHAQDTSLWRRLAKIMAKLGWQQALVPDDRGGRVKGYRKHRY